MVLKVLSIFIAVIII